MNELSERRRRFTHEQCESYFKGRPLQGGRCRLTSMASFSPSECGHSCLQRGEVTERLCASSQAFCCSIIHTCVCLRCLQPCEVQSGRKLSDHVVDAQEHQWNVEHTLDVNICHLFCVVEPHLNNVLGFVIKLIIEGNKTERNMCLWPLTYWFHVSNRAFILKLNKSGTNFLILSDESVLLSENSVKERVQSQG